MNFDEFEKLSKGERETLLNGVDFIVDMMTKAGDARMACLQKYRNLAKTSRKIVYNLSVLQFENKALLEQAINLFEQVDTLLKDFAIENNLEAEDD